jgi:predicted AlkP superfamily phosphohydrolase/phosphomutase
VAWGAGGYYARLFLNVQGREPSGIIPAGQIEAFKAEITAKLEAITDPQGRELGTRVYRPEETYSQVNNIPPDLIAYLGNLAWRSVGSIGNETIHVFENDTGPDDANHAQDGLYILQRPGIDGGGRADHTWQAIAPTMLEILGLPVPADMSPERLG